MAPAIPPPIGPAFENFLPGTSGRVDAVGLVGPVANELDWVPFAVGNGDDDVGAVVDGRTGVES